jgi:phospholipid transport system substrate-binding protein
MGVTTAIVKELQVNKSKYTSNRAALDNLIRTRVLPFMDFDAMSKLTLGKHWRSASASQRTRFVSAYREMLIRSYGKIMLKYAGATIRAGKSVPGRRAGYVSVRTTVTPRGGAPIAALLALRTDGWLWVIPTRRAYHRRLAANWQQSPGLNIAGRPSERAAHTWAGFVLQLVSR